MNDSIMKLLKDRYFLPTESSWEDIAKRVGKLYESITDDIVEMNFIPSSPTLMNYCENKERLGTLSSCFPMHLEDSIEGIFDSLKEGAITTKLGGGVGYDFSELRSSKENIKTLNANSSGPLAFIENFNSMLESIQQGGKRRGAGMGLLSIEHPDILQFIKVKKDLNRINRLNVSVKIPNSFYEKLEITPNEIHKVKYKDGTEHDLLDENNNPVTVKQLWDLIIEMSWKVAEPGIFNETIAFERCTVTNISNSVICNPCLTGDTLIAVADGRGVVPIKQLVNEKKDILVYTLDHKGNVVVKPMLYPRLTQKNSKIYKVTFDSGLEIKCTSNHKFLSTDGKFIDTIELKNGDSIKSIIKHKCKLDEAYPWMKRTSGQDYLFIENNGKFKAEHRIIAEHKIGRILSNNEIVHHNNYIGLDNSLDNLSIMTNKDHIDFHRKDMIGKNNSVFRIKDRNGWIKKLKENSTGLKNKNAKELSNNDIVKLVKKYSKSTLYNLFCYKHWVDLCQKGLTPLLNTNNKDDKYRFNNPKDYCDLANVKYVRTNIYNRIEEHYTNLIISSQKFDFDMETFEFRIYKICENCGKDFIVDYYHRQVTFCSSSCMHHYIQKPFMFDESQFSKKYLNNLNTRKRLEKTLEIFFAYKKVGKNYINFIKDYKGAKSVIRPNNIFCPSLQYLKDNANKIKTIEDIVKLAEKNISGFKNKIELKKAIGDSFNHKVISVEFIGYEDVYDGTVEDFHTILIGGKEFTNKFGKQSYEFIVTGQCSEFVNIPYTSCSLGSINISNLVEGKTFNWDKFENLIIKATKFINSTLDNNKFPIKKIKDITLKTRPIGIGIMGFSHALYKKEIPYNSEKAIKFTEQVFRYLTLRSMKESMEMAKKEGAYEAFDYNLFIKANERFFKHKNCRNIDIEQLQKDIKKHGTRNSCFTSIAPTGSISTIANCSSGIEPVFALTYMRRVEKLNKEYDIMYISDPVFDEYLNKNFSVEQKGKILKEIVENNGSCQKCNDIPKDIRKIFIVAADLAPTEHLDILEATANNVSLSVSKTINLPFNIDKKEISKVFLEAHKRGIIGVTCYRDGSREGILIHNIENKREGIIKDNHAPKRPIKLPCEIHRIVHQGKKWIVFVGILENRLYEVFAGAISDVNIPKTIEKGFIIKQKKRQYAFEFEDEILINDIQKSFANKENDAFARSISLALRHGTPIVYIVETLNKSEGDITSFSKAISRTIKKYIKDGEHAGKCPECGAKLIYYEGCIKCSQCHHSKCG